MLFYTSLFVASLVAALVLFWIYNVVVDSGRAVNRALHSNSKSKHTDELEREINHTAGVDVPSVWGQGDHSNPSQAARTAAIAPSHTVPWGWPNYNQRQSEPAQQHNVSGQQKALPTGWPSRVDRPELAGTKYKVSRKSKNQDPSLSVKNKQWGW